MKDDFSDVQSVYDEKDDCLNGIELNIQTSIFHNIYSCNDETLSTKSTSESDNETNDEDDFTIGVKSFIENYKTTQTYHPTKRLIACLTYERINTSNQVVNCKNTNNEWILLIQLMCVTKKYRGFGIGAYLINFIKSNLKMGIVVMDNYYL
jgi:hypothetical protein